jgi:general secretion pathway protein L
VDGGLPADEWPTVEMISSIGLAREGIAAFFDWWWRELASLVPRRLRRATRREGRMLVLEFGEVESLLLERTASGERVLGTGAPDFDQGLSALLQRRRRRAVTVRLRPELGLCKQLELPAAARDDLQQVLRFEMDHLTPFSADEVYFAQRVLHSDASNRRISVELQLAPKRVVEQAIETARRFGVVPSRIELAEARAKGEALDLLPGAPRESAREGRLHRALGLLALVLAVIAVGIPLQRQRATVAELEAQVATAQANAEESLALREQLDQLTRSAQFLVAEKTRRAMMTEVLAELTRLLPDQAHIVQLQLQDGTVQLHGFAATASDLIGLLDQSPLFNTPEFRSPVTQDPRSGTERFHVSVELVAREGG